MGNARKYNKRAMDALFNVRMTDASIRQTRLFLPKIDKDEIFIRLPCLCLRYGAGTRFHHNTNEYKSSDFSGNLKGFDSGFASCRAGWSFPQHWECLGFGRGRAAPWADSGHQHSTALMRHRHGPATLCRPPGSP